MKTPRIAVTSRSVGSDESSQCFSRETALGNHWGNPSLPSLSPRNTEQETAR